MIKLYTIQKHNNTGIIAIKKPQMEMLLFLEKKDLAKTFS